MHFWSRILEDKIIGTVFFNQNRTGDIFADLRESTLLPLYVLAMEDQNMARSNYVKIIFILNWIVLHPPH